MTQRRARTAKFPHVAGLSGSGESLLGGKRNNEDDVVVPCKVEMDSHILQGHTHTCGGHHSQDGGHMCTNQKCRRWFWKKGTLV
jgi:hypothetical protein